MKPPSSSAKVGFVGLGLLGAIAAGCLAMKARELAMTDTPTAQSSPGMSGFGDLVTGIAAFGVVALVPLGLALYWLRPVPRFWSILTKCALVFAVTGPVAVAVAKWLSGPPGTLAFLAFVRIGAMPLTALALLTCALFAPVARQRLLMGAAALVDGAVFAGIIVVHLVLPSIGG